MQHVLIVSLNGNGNGRVASCDSEWEKKMFEYFLRKKLRFQSNYRSESAWNWKQPPQLGFLSAFLLLFEFSAVELIQYWRLQKLDHCFYTVPAPLESRSNDVLKFSFWKKNQKSELYPIIYKTRISFVLITFKLAFKYTVSLIVALNSNSVTHRFYHISNEQIFCLIIWTNLCK